MLIFIFQAIWFFIDEFAGKGLDFIIISKFLFYYSPTLVNRVLPLTVLLSSIMTFGSFAENYEFAAMKASGISLRRAMKSLIIFISFLGIGTFLFANNVIPHAEFKSYNLRKNIAKLKPALAINEGIFNDIGDINIKVDEKYGENDNFLKNVIIHKKNKNGENRTVIRSLDGELKSDDDSNILGLILKNGNYYEDVKPSNPKNQDKYPHAKAHFETYTINIDLNQFNNVDLESQSVNNRYKMLNVSELNYFIDSIGTQNKDIVKGFGDNLYRRVGFTTLNAQNEEKQTQAIQKKQTDSIKQNIKSITSTQDLLGLFEEWKQEQILGDVQGKLRRIISTIEGKKKEFFLREKLLNHHYIALHSKYALPLACIILFFVGAPLGAIVRKGGIGLPMVLAIILFLVYYFIDIFAKNYAEDGSISPILGAWLSAIVMLPLSVLLTRNATADKGIFDTDSIAVGFRKIFRKKKEQKE